MTMKLDTFQTPDPTRRRIVEVLRKGEQPVGDLVARAGIHQSGVSRHLGILQAAGFVSMRPDKQRRLYSLRPDPFPDLQAWRAPHPRLWEARLHPFGPALNKERHSPTT